MRWYRNFVVAGVLKKEPYYIQTKKKYKSEYAKFTLVQQFEGYKAKVFYIQTFDKHIIEGLKRIKRQSLVKVEGEIYCTTKSIYLLAHKFTLAKIGKEKLEVNNGNENDSDNTMAGQGISQDKVD